MSEIKVDSIGPRVDSGTLTIGAAGDTVNIAGTAGTGFPAGVSLSGSTNNTVATVTGANALAGETNFIYNGTIVGAGADGANADLGAGVHVKTADASQGSINANADELILENSAGCGITILSGASNLGRVAFGDSGDGAVAYIDYNHSTNELSLTGNGNTALKIDSAGRVTKPLQPTFVVSPSSNSGTIGADTTYDIVAGTEIKDIGGNWSSATFTAPITGSYLFTHSINVANYDHDNNYSAVFINTSNRRYTSWFAIGNAFSVDGAYFFSGSAIADMDANDTCVFQFRNDQGAAQPVINQEFTFLGGTLLC